MNTIRTRLVSHLLTSITLMVAMVAAAPAFAQAPKPPLARPAAPASKGPDPAALVRSAEAKTKSGDLAGALADYQAADAVKPTSELAFAVGDTQDKLGKLREAVVSYERFLASVPARMKVKGEEVQKRVAEIKGMPGKLHIDTSPPGAVVLVDSKPQPGKTPTDVDLPSGKHVLRVELEGHQPAEKEVAVDYAGKQDLSFELQKPPPPPLAPVVAETPPPPTPAPAPAPPPPPPSKLPAYITGGIAIVAAGIGTGFGISALSQASDFKKTPTADLADSGENAALVADMCFGVAITFGVTSAVLFLTKDPPKAGAQAAPAVKAAQPRVTVTPTPYITHGGGGAGALVRF